MECLCFINVQNLLDIHAIENWNVSKGTNFESMFGECSKLSVMKSIQKWNISKEQSELITNKN